MLYSRKQLLENLDPTPQWPWMSPFHCLPVTTYPPWRGPSSVRATLSSSAASLIPGAPHHCDGRRTEHAPGRLRALTGRCSDHSLETWADSKARGGFGGVEVQWAGLYPFSPFGTLHFYLHYTLGPSYGFIWTKILKDADTKRVWKLLG